MCDVEMTIHNLKEYLYLSVKVKTPPKKNKSDTISHRNTWCCTSALDKRNMFKETKGMHYLYSLEEKR